MSKYVDPAKYCTSLRQITDEEEKRALMPLLLLADPSERMIARYWGRSLFFVLEDEEKVIGSVLVSFSGDGTTGEVHNLAVLPECWRQGHGRRLMDGVAEYAGGRCSVLLVGTAAVSETALRFYTGCGYTFSHIVPRFFTDNYEEPLWGEGKQCVDMVYLRKIL